MPQGAMKQQFAWAVVSKDGKLGVFAGQCPIYWRRYIAQQECDRQNGARTDYHVEKITLLAVYRYESSHLGAWNHALQARRAVTRGRGSSG